MNLTFHPALFAKKILLILSLLLIQTVGFSQDDPVMIFEGKIKDGNGKALSGALVKILQNGKEVHSATTNSSGEFKSYSGYYGYTYKVIVTKGNHATNTFEINSSGYDEEVVEAEVRVPIKAVLDEKKEGVDYSVIEKKPIEKFAIDNVTGQITDDASYYQSRKGEIAAYFKKLAGDAKDKERKFKQLVKSGDAAYGKKDFGLAIEDWKAALKIKYDEELAIKITNAEFEYEDELAAKENETKMKKLVREGDELVALLKFDNAKEKYEDAQSFMPKSKIPKQKLKELQKKIEEQQGAKVDKEFKELMGRASIKVSSESYEEAKQLYNQAQLLKPKDKDPAKKIKEIAKIIAEKAKNKEKYDNLIVEANTSFDAKVYGKAKEKYNEALKLFPKEILPQTKLKEIESILAKQKEKEEEYKNLVATANGEFDKKKYSEAISNYEKALLIKPQESKPKEQIVKAKSALEAIKKADEDYKNLMTEADNAFNGKQYQASITSYEKALKIKPTEQTPKDQIQKAKAEIAAIKKLEEDYKNAIAAADKEFGDKKYESSILNYEKASKLKPEEQKPKDQIEKAKAEIAAIKKREEDYANAMTEGENKFSSKQFEEAISAYEKASKIKPEEQKPKEQIEKAKAEIAAIKKAEEDYKNFMSTANKEFDEKNYEASISTYEKALKVKPEEAEPKTKIEKAKAEIAAIKKRNEDYADAMKTGEAAFGSEKFEEALADFKKAQSIKPEEAEPKKKIDAVNAAIEAARIAKEALEAEAKRKEEEAKKKAEEELARKKAEEEKKKQEELARLEKERLEKEKAKQKAEEEAKRKEEEAKKKAEEELARKKAEEEKKKQEELARLEKERLEKEKAKQKTEEKARKKAEEKKKRAAEQALLEAERKKKEAEELAKKEAEKAKRAEAERAKQEAKRKADELAQKEAKERARKAEEAAKRRAEEEAQLAAALAKKAAEDKEKQDAERARLAAEQAQKEKDAKAKLAAEQKKRKQDELARLEAEKTRNAEAEKARLARERAKKAAEDKAKLADEKAKREAELKRNKEKNQRYANLIEKGDDQFNDKEYRSAKNTFNSALAIFPAQKYPKERIKAINEILNKMSEEERNAVSSMDDYFNIDAELYGEEVDMSTKDGSFLLTNISDNSAMREYMELKRYIDSSISANKNSQLKDSDLAQLTYQQFEEIKSHIYNDIGTNDYGRHGSITSIELFLNSNANRNKTEITNHKSDNLNSANTLNRLQEKYLETYRDLADRKRDIGFEYQKYSDLNSELMKAKTVSNIRTNQEIFEELEKFKENLIRDLSYDEREYVQSNEDFLDLQEKLEELKVNLRDKEKLSQKFEIDYLENTTDLILEKSKNGNEKITKNNDALIEYAEDLVELKDGLNKSTGEKIITSLNQLSEIEENQITIHKEFLAKSKLNNEDYEEYRDDLAALNKKLGKNDGDKISQTAQEIADIEDEVLEKNRALASKTNDNTKDFQDYQDKRTELKGEESIQNAQKTLKNSQRLTKIQDKLGESKSDENKDELALLFPEGITQKVYQKKNNFGEVVSITVRRIVVRGNKGNDYVHKKSKAGNFYFKNGMSISENTWDLETSGEIVNN